MCHDLCQKRPLLPCFFMLVMIYYFGFFSWKSYWFLNYTFFLITRIIFHLYFFLFNFSIFASQTPTTLPSFFPFQSDMNAWIKQYEIFCCDSMILALLKVVSPFRGVSRGAPFFDVEVWGCLYANALLPVNLENEWSRRWTRERKISETLNWIRLHCPAMRYTHARTLLCLYRPSSSWFSKNREFDFSSFLKKELGSKWNFLSWKRRVAVWGEEEEEGTGRDGFLDCFWYQLRSFWYEKELVCACVRLIGLQLETRFSPSFTI